MEALFEPSCTILVSKIAVSFMANGNICSVFKFLKKSCAAVVCLSTI